MYRKMMLEHYHHPRNQGVIENPSTTIHAVNRVCGDELMLYLQTKDNFIKDIKMNVKGCSICIASASMMSEIVLGLPFEHASNLVESFKQIMTKHREWVLLPDLMVSLDPLQEVKKYPVRVKCALLPWDGLRDALETVRQTSHEVLRV